MPTFDKKKSFMMRSGNSPMFKMMGSSPVLKNGSKQKIKGSNINITGKNVDVQKIEEKEIEKKIKEKVETGVEKVDKPTPPTPPTPPKKDKPVTPPKKGDEPGKYDEPPKKEKIKTPGDPPPKNGEEKEDPISWWRRGTSLT